MNEFILACEVEVAKSDSDCSSHEESDDFGTDDDWDDKANGTDEGEENKAIVDLKPIQADQYQTVYVSKDPSFNKNNMAWVFRCTLDLNEGRISI